MGTVDGTVADLIRRFPTSYANRTQALHYLLCVVGNGYRWAGGELLCFDGEASTEETAREMVLAPLIRNYGAEHELVVQTRASIDAEIAAHLWRRKHADELARTPGPLHREVYPPSSLSALATMPADATPDWRAAAREITAAIDATTSMY